MATQQDSSMTYKLGGTVAIYRLLKIDTADGDAIHNTATATDVPFAVSQEAGVETDSIEVRDVKQGGTHKVTALTDIAKGAKIYAAAADKIQKIPTAPGTYRCVGQNTDKEAAAADGDVIEVWLTPEGDMETISGS